jgi:hypothetical protein
LVSPKDSYGGGDGLNNVKNTCHTFELISPNPPGIIGKKERNCAIFKVPLFLREGFSQRDAFGKGEFFVKQAISNTAF